MDKKKAAKIIAAFIAGCFICFYSAAIFAKNIKKVDKQVALVNGTSIYESDLDRHVNLLYRQYADKKKPMDEKQLEKIKDKVLDDLISRELLFQESVKSGIKIADSVVNKEFDSIKGRYKNKADFKKALSAMDLTQKILKKNIRQGMSVKGYIDKKIITNIKVDEKEQKSYYESHKDMFKQPEKIRASHILIKVDKTASKKDKEKAKAEIERLKKRIKAGEDFAELAKKFSQGPSAGNGGELGYFPRGKMVKPFEDAAFSLKPGQVSDLVETRFGYHLIKVLDRKPPSTMSFDQIKSRLGEYIKQGKIRDQIKRKVEGLKKTAKIEKMLEKKG